MCWDPAPSTGPAADRPAGPPPVTNIRLINLFMNTYVNRGTSWMCRYCFTSCLGCITVKKC